MDKLTLSNERDRITNQSEERLLALMKATSDVIYRMSPDWKIMTELFRRGFLADTDEADPCWLDKYIHPNDQAHVFEVIENCISKKQVFELEHRVLRADGSIGWTYSRAVPLFDDKGDIKEWIGAASDITERKRSEEKLKESEEKYHVLFDSIDAGFCIVEVLFDENDCSIDYRFLEVNRSFEKQTGLVDATGRRMRDMAPDHEQHWFDIYGRIALTGEPIRFQNTAEALGRFYDVYAFRVGKPEQRRVAILFNDVSERKRAEEALCDRTRELEEANRQKEDILESISDCFYALDMELRFTYVNKAAEEIWGLSRADLMGQKIENVFRNLIDISLSKFRKVLEEKVPQHYEVFSKVALKWGDMSVYPTRNGISVYFHDTTERKKSEEALRESEKKYRLLFENMTELFQILEPLFDDAGKIADFRYIEINKASEILAGRKKEEIEGKTAKELWGIVEDYWLEMLGKVMRTGESAHMKNYSRELDAYYDLYAWKASERRVAIVFTNITVNKKAEKALRESERVHAFQSAILESVRDPLWANDSGLRIVYWNDAATATFGWTADEVKGRNTGELFRMLVPGSTRDGAVAHLLQTGDFRGEIVCHCKDGHPILAEASSRVVRGPDGEVIRVVSTARDITERKRAEEQLKFQANLLSAVHDGIIAVDENMTITYWNESAEKITGWPVSEAIGQSGKEIFAHLKVDRLWGEMTADLDRLGYYYREVWANRKDGELFYADLHMKRIFGHDGKFRGTITTFRDITQRRKMEEALKASEEMLRTVLDMSLDGIYRFNYMTELFDYLSPSAASILGYSVEELLHMDKAEMHAMVHPDDVPGMLAEIGHIEITGEATAEYRQKHKNGTFVWMSNHMSIVRDDKGSPVYRYGNLRDITESKRAEDALRKSDEEKTYLLKLSDALRPIRDPVQVQLTACRMLGEHIGASRVLYGDVIDENKVVISRDYTDGVPPIAATLNAADFSQFTIDSYKSGKNVIINDISTDPRMSDEERIAFKSIQAAANMSLGLLKEGKWVAVFGAHHKQPRVWTPLEIMLMEDTAERTWEAVERAKAEQTLREREESQKFLLRFGDALRPLTSETHILQTAARLLGEYLNADRAFFGELYQEENLAIMLPDYARGNLPSLAGRYKITDFQETVEALESGRPYVINDVANSKLLSEHTRFAYLSLGYASFFSVPLFKRKRLINQRMAF